MSVVTISDLKNRLSHYLRLVRKGHSVLVSDRNRVVARIDPAGDESARPGTSDGEWLGELERRGVIRRGSGRLSRTWLRERPKMAPDLLGALLDERVKGR